MRKKKTVDRYNRVVAICFKKRRDINSWLVRNGLAVAYTKYSKKYIINENDAKKEKKGLWAGNFDGSGFGSGIYKSNDGGNTWKEISGGKSGFPDTRGTGRIGLAISNSNSNILYAILDNQDRKEKINTVNEEVINKDILRNITNEDFLKLKDSDLNSFLRDNRFPREYNSKSVKELVKNNSISAIALVEYLEDSNTLLYDTPVKGAEVYRSDDGGISWYIFRILCGWWPIRT